jgi:hypothetical protein
MAVLKRFGWLALSLILAPFVLDRANSDFEKAPGSAAAVVVLLLICLGQSIAHALLRKRYTELERRLRASGPSQLVVNMALDRLVRPKDTSNRYTLIKAFAHIDGEGNYKAQYERHGINQARAAVDRIRVLTCADSNMEFAELQVQAVDLNSNRARLKVVVIEDNSHQKLFDIYFKKPVQPNDRFAVGWSFVWPRVMRASGDYDFVVLKDFERGVERLSYTLEFERELPSFRFEKMTKNGEWEPLAEGKEQQQGNFYTYTLEIDGPECDAYKFSYQG